MRIVLLMLLAGTAAAAPWTDAPAWKGGTRIEVTWVVGPNVKNPHDPYGDGWGLPLEPVTLELRLGAVTRSIVLAPETGGLRGTNQVICPGSAYRLDPDELAKLTFYEGGASGYRVTRPSPDVLEIRHWSQSDGACEDPKTHALTACPADDEVVAKLHVPATAKVVGGAIALVDHGKRAPFSCK